MKKDFLTIFRVARRIDKKCVYQIKPGKEMGLGDS